MNEGHRYSSWCHMNGCEACKKKFMEEHTDTLPPAAKEASLELVKQLLETYQ